MVQHFFVLIKQVVSKKSELLVNIVKWILFVVSVGYLVLLFMEIRSNEAFEYGFVLGFKNRILWLSLLLLLLPFNLFCEAYKWKLIVSDSQKISLLQSFEAILAGSSTAFFSPNRTGEFVGRALHFKTENRKLLIPFAFINSLSQNIVLIVFGFPVAVLFFLEQNRPTIITASMLLQASAVVFFSLLFLMAFWIFLRKIEFKGRLWQIKKTLLSFKLSKLLKILGVSLLRYFIFSVQFYFMLRFFDVHLGVWQAILALPTNYFFVTLAPAFAFSEAGVRGSMAVLIIGAFSSQLGNIALAGIAIWLINFVLPMLLGSVILVIKKQLLKSFD